MPNRLVDLVEAGRILDEAELRRVFRKLAKRIHPDLAGAEGGADGAKAGAPDLDGKAFIALRADYEAARRLLASRPAPAGVTPLPYSRRGLYRLFQELLTRGFPRLPGKRWPNGPLSGYDRARQTFLGLLAGRDQVEPSLRSLAAFLEFEAGYVALALADRGGLSAEVRTARGLRELMLSVASYQGSGMPQPLRYAANEWPRLRAELHARGEARPLAFLEILMADLEGGPADAGDARPGAAFRAASSRRVDPRPRSDLYKKA